MSGVQNVEFHKNHSRGQFLCLFNEFNKFPFPKHHECLYKYMTWTFSCADWACCRPRISLKGHVFPLRPLWYFQDSRSVLSKRWESKRSETRTWPQESRENTERKNSYDQHKPTYLEGERDLVSQYSPFWAKDGTPRDQSTNLTPRVPGKHGKTRKEKMARTNINLHIWRGDVILWVNMDSVHVEWCTYDLFTAHSISRFLPPLHSFAGSEYTVRLSPVCEDVSLSPPSSLPGPGISKKKSQRVVKPYCWCSLNLRSTLASFPCAVGC